MISLYRFLLGVLPIGFGLMTLSSCTSAEIDVPEPSQETSKIGTSKIYGVITDAQSGEPVPYVTVTVKPGQHKVTSGYDGRYQFINLEPGTYIVQTENDNYLSKCASTVISNEGITCQCDIAMQRGKHYLQVSFGDVNFNQNTTEQTFIITNVGDEAIDWKCVYNKVSHISIGQDSGMLLPGMSDKVAVRVNSMTGTSFSPYIIYVVGEGEECGVLVENVKRPFSYGSDKLIGKWGVRMTTFFDPWNDDIMTFNSMTNHNTSQWYFYTDGTFIKYDFSYFEYDGHPDMHRENRHDVFQSRFDVNIADGVLRLENSYYGIYVEDAYFYIDQLDDNNLVLKSVLFDPDNREGEIYSFVRL